MKIRNLLIFCLPTMLLLSTASFAQSTCYSGDCKNGEGELYDGTGTYHGMFKDGKRVGHAKYLYRTSVSLEDVVYEGDWVNDVMPEYVMVYLAKIGNYDGKITPIGAVSFRKLHSDGSHEDIVMQPDGPPKEIYTNKKGKETVKNIKDLELHEMYNRYMAKNSSVPVPGRRIVYRGTVAVGRDVWVDLASWDFVVEDNRHYIVFATSQLKNKTMPFGGQLTIQISDAAGRVVKETTNSGYATFKPIVSGHYTCLVKFTQSYINAKDSDLSQGFYVTAGIDSDDDDGRNY